MLILFALGLLTGLSISTFILGKELFYYYKKHASLLTKVNRIELLNRQLTNKIQSRNEDIELDK